MQLAIDWDPLQGPKWLQQPLLHVVIEQYLLLGHHCSTLWSSGLLNRDNRLEVNFCLLNTRVISYSCPLWAMLHIETITFLRKLVMVSIIQLVNDVANPFEQGQLRSALSFVFTNNMQSIHITIWLLMQIRYRTFHSYAYYYALSVYLWFYDNLSYNLKMQYFLGIIIHN